MGVRLLGALRRTGIVCRSAVETMREIDDQVCTRLRVSYYLELEQLPISPGGVANGTQSKIKRSFIKMHQDRPAPWLQQGEGRADLASRVLVLVEVVLLVWASWGIVSLSAGGQ